MTYLALIGGGFFAVWFLQTAWEWAAFKRVMNDPVAGKLGSTAAGYLTAVAISIIGLGAGWEAFLYYVAGTLLVGFLEYRAGVRLRESQPAGIEETFS